MRLGVGLFLLIVFWVPTVAQPVPQPRQAKQKELTADGSAKMSVFAVFETLCIETDVQKEAVRARALSLGALPFKQPDIEAANALYRLADAQVDRVAWLVKSGNRQFEVYFTSVNVAASQRQQGVHTDQCNVIFRGDDVEGTNEMERWVGISDDDTIKSAFRDSKRYEFQVIGGSRVPLPKSWRVDPSFSKIVTWQAEVSRSPVSSLLLERTRPL